MLRKLLLTISTMLMVILGGFAVSQVSVTSAQPPFATGQWTATFYSDTSFTNVVQSGVTYPSLNFVFSGAPTFSNGSPIGGMPADNWSAVFTKSATFTAGTYRFTLTADDRARFTVNGTEVINIQQANLGAQSVDLQLPSGTINFRIEFVEFENQAILQLVEPTSGGSSPFQTPGVPFLFTPTPTSPPTQTALPPIPPGSITATVIRAGALIIRDAPSLGGGRIGLILRGQTYAIVGRDQDARWFLLQLGGYQGWAYGYYLFVDGNEFTPPIVSGNTVIGLAGQEDYGVRGQTDAILRLRAAPNVAAMQTGRITWGAFLPITGRTADGFWYQVIWKNTVGWAYAPFINIVEGDLNNVPFK